MAKKVVFITGGSKGIGFGIAEVLLTNGYRVAFTGRNEKNVQEAEKELKNRFSQQDVLGYICDVVNMEQSQNVVKNIQEQWGSIDIVIANAGVGHLASIDDITEAQWHETIDVNLTGVFNTLKVNLEDLKKTKGYFITIASLAGTNFFAGGAAYNASKFGLVGFTQAVMLDLRKYGIKVTTIMPGSVTSFFNHHVPSEADDWKIQPEDIGQIIHDLLNMHPRTLPSKIEVRPSQPK
ncbi:MAG: SDR family oxidoreductase [Saprospiraceae bacterium]